MEFIFKRIQPCGVGYLLNDQKVTEESPGENTIGLRRQTALSSMIFSPGPQEIRLAAVGFSMASETESSCTPIWSKRLVINGGARRPTSECYPASPLAEAFFQDYCDSRTDSQRPERAGACLVSAEIPARRSKSGSGARRTLIRRMNS